MFILMVTPGMGGSWLPVTPPRYDHLTLSRSMSGLTAGWEHSHSRLGFSTAAPRLSVGCWSCLGWEL